jgi:hypothetical protein
LKQGKSFVYHITFEFILCEQWFAPASGKVWNKFVNFLKHLKFSCVEFGHSKTFNRASLALIRVQGSTVRVSVVLFFFGRFWSGVKGFCCGWWWGSLRLLLSSWVKLFVFHQLRQKRQKRIFFVFFVDFIEYLVINIFLGFFLFGAFSSHPEGYWLETVLRISYKGSSEFCSF